MLILNFLNGIFEWIDINKNNLIYTAIMVLIALILWIIMRIIIHRINKRSGRRVYTVAKLIYSIVKAAIIILALFIILSIWGVNVTAALAGLGIVGLVIGLGAQDVIKDFLAGIGIVFENYYEIDEVVQIDGFKGKVIEIGLRSTKLLNALGEVKIFANRNITEVSNFSRTFSLAVVSVVISYQENIDEVMSLLDEQLSNLKENYPQIIEGPIVAGVDDLTSNGVAIRITAKTNPEEHYSVQRALKKFIKELFDANNIVIPINQIIIYQGTNKNE